MDKEESGQDFPVIDNGYYYNMPGFYECIPYAKSNKASYTKEGTTLRPLNTFVISGIMGPGLGQSRYTSINKAIEYTIEQSRTKFWVGPHWSEVLAFLKSEKKRILSNLYVSFPEYRFMLRKGDYPSENHLSLYVLIE